MTPVAVSAQTQTASQTLATAPASDGNAIADIIVTATKRQSSLQHTAASISALNGDVMRLKGTEGLQNIPATVPNVTFNSTSNSAQIYIRGIGNTFIQAGGDPGVAFHSENAYVTDQRTINSGLFDIKRVEVLEGPQGALYGRNAVGGAINVIFNKPTDTLTANVDFIVGDYGRRESEGAVSGPLGFANTSARISYQIKSFGGYTTNLAAATVPGAPRKFDDLHSQAFRVQTQTDFDGGGHLNLMYTHFNEHENGQSLKVEPWQGFVYPAQVLFGEVPTSDPRSVYATVGYTSAQVDDLNANLVQPLGAYTLSGTASYRTARQDFLDDCDSTIKGDCTYFTGTSSHDFFSDIHLASPNTGILRWLVGGTYSHYTVSQLVSVPVSSVNSYIGLTPPNGSWPFDYLGGGHIKQDSFAVYGSARAQLTSIFAVTGELRYAETTKNLDESLVFPFFGINVAHNFVRLHNSFLPYKFGGEAQVTPDILVYASYATANKDGAVNPGALQASPVLPEKARTIEAGFKTSFFSRRLQINGAIFTTDYDNLQVQQVQTNSDVLANAPKSRIRGAELTVVAAPTDRLRVTFNGGVIDGKFLKFTNASTHPGGFDAPMNLAGNKLPYVAPVSVSVDGGYRFALSDTLELQTDVIYSYHGRTYFDEFQRTSNSQRPIGLLDFSASLTKSGAPWRIFGYVRNITDKVVATGSTIYSPNLGSERATNYAPPRNFGIGAAITF